MELSFPLLVCLWHWNIPKAPWNTSISRLSTSLYSQSYDKYHVEAQKQGFACHQCARGRSECSGAKTPSSSISPFIPVFSLFSLPIYLLHKYAFFHLSSLSGLSCRHPGYLFFQALKATNSNPFPVKSSFTFCQLLTGRVFFVSLFLLSLHRMEFFKLRRKAYLSKYPSISGWMSSNNDPKRLRLSCNEMRQTLP